MADRIGRRSTLVVTCAIGLTFTVAAALSPSYWWFVAIFALGRPFLTATGGVAQVSAAELTDSHDRAKAVALVAAGYGFGAGLLAVVHSLASGTLGFRGVFALAVVPLVLLPWLARRVVEPDRFVQTDRSDYAPPVIGPVERRFRGRLLLVCAIAFAISVMTGPANSLVFAYAQNVRHVPGALTAAMVAAAGVTGLIGLLAGRFSADRFGRRPTVALAMMGMAGFGVLTYSGSRPGLIAGYALGVMAGSFFAPAGGALANELFSTSVRASVAGWIITAGVLGAVCGLLEFGAVADAGNQFGVAAGDHLSARGARGSAVAGAAGDPRYRARGALARRTEAHRCRTAMIDAGSASSAPRARRSRRGSCLGDDHAARASAGGFGERGGRPRAGRSAWTERIARSSRSVRWARSSPSARPARSPPSVRWARSSPSARPARSSPSVRWARSSPSDPPVRSSRSVRWPACGPSVRLLSPGPGCQPDRSRRCWLSGRPVGPNSALRGGPV